MKKLIIVTLGLACAMGVLANGGKFEKAMAENIPAVFSAASPEATQAVINKLSRVGAAEGNRWEPYYYSAFGYIRISQMLSTAEEKDQYLGLALAELEKGETIEKTPEGSISQVV